MNRLIPQHLTLPLKGFLPHDGISLRNIPSGWFPAIAYINSACASKDWLLIIPPLPPLPNSLTEPSRADSEKLFYLHVFPSLPESLSN